MRWHMPQWNDTHLYHLYRHFDRGQKHALTLQECVQMAQYLQDQCEEVEERERWRVLEAALRAEISQLQRQHAEDVAQLRSQHAAQISQRSAQHDAILGVERERWRKLEAALQAEIAQLKSQHTEDVA